MLDVNFFDSMRISIASPEKIRSWSHGEVKKPETINYRTLKPERDGLFCEKIFGPTRDWECHCGKYKRVRYKGIVCDRCGVEVTRAKVRRERMGHIELAAPVSHIWYFKGIPSRMGLLLDMSPRALEKVLYFAAYIVLDPGKAAYNSATKKGLQQKDLLTEGMCRANRELYGKDAFKVGIGAEAIQKMLREIDLEELSVRLREDLKSSSGQKRVRAIRRLEVVEAFRKSGNKPEWMILTVIPVIPPDLRPMVQLDGGRFATSDLNDLYRRVINRNNRLNRLLSLRAPDIITRNEKRMLQEAVDALIDNGRRGRPVTGPANRPLKSLSDLLKGKQGRFRQNLLGKRVDYSGRSVIVVGPSLKLHQCGIPKEMALELFKPFVMKKLSADAGLTIKAAKKKVDRASEDVWAVLEQVIQHHPVLLNRAPTLHRLGIQAFEPVLTEGRALKLHPLACTAYNADFDGDQMAIHLPLSAEAQAEARVLMLAANHILAPKDGKPIIVPTQDMVLGTYYLTKVRKGAKGSGRIFSSFEEALLAYFNGVVELQAEIFVRLGKLVKTSVGRLIFNEKLPEQLRHYQEEDGFITLGKVMDKKTLAKLVAECFNKFGATRTAEVIDQVKNLGYTYACLAGMTIAISDVIVPPNKKDILAQTAARVKVVENYFARGILTEKERYDKVCALWTEATDLVADAMMQNLDEFNPIYMMAKSGARGNKKQMRQLAGMRGLMADPSGKIIELPITTNFREGLSVSDYFISSHGARKGLADTALRTADSGYLTRRLVDVAQDVIVRQVDCDVTSINLLLVRAHLAEETFDALELFDDALLGRVLAEDAFDPQTGEIVLPKDTILNTENLVILGEHSVHEIALRGCAFTLPVDTNTRVNEVIKLGAHGNADQIREAFIHEYVGKELASPLEFAQLKEGDILTHDVLDAALDDDDVREISIRNHSLRGIFVEAIREDSDYTPQIVRTESEIRLDVSEVGIIESLRDRINGRTLAEDIVSKSGEIIGRVNDPIDEALAERIVNSIVERRTVKVQGLFYDEDIYDRHLQDGKPVMLCARSTLIGDNEKLPFEFPERVCVRSVLTCRSSRGVCIKCYGQDLANKTEVEIGEAVGIIAAQSIGEPGTQLTMRTFHTGGIAGGDITQGLPRVEELFEARKPKVCAILSEIDGVVSFSVSDKKDNLRLLNVTPTSYDTTAENETPYEITYETPYETPYDAPDTPGTSDVIITSDTDGNLSGSTNLNGNANHSSGISGSANLNGNANHSGRINVSDGSFNASSDTKVPNPYQTSREYKLPFGVIALVKEGDYVTAGTPLTAGAKNPHDILRIQGLQATYRYLVKEVQKVYKSQGVEINDKHIEVMVRQMLHKVRIEDSGSTEFLPGEFVDINVFEAANTRAIEEDKAPAVAKPLLLGITKASLATDSFLSAASFQETTRVLTDAAIKGKVDPLIGLKENVIIGKLIPAGTGMARYRGLTVVDTEAEEEQSATE